VSLLEHDLTLEVAYRLKAQLESEGAQVCVTRRPAGEGGHLVIEPYDYTGDSRVRPVGRTVEDVPELIQPRIDWANSFRAEILVSIHFNGSEDRRLRGTEVYYTNAGAREAQGRKLAQSLLSALTAEMRQAGHAPLDRGVRSDRYQRYSPQETLRLFANNAAVIRANGHDPGDCPDCYRLLTLGNNPMSLHRGEYVGALVEVEFLSNPDVVEGFILRPDSLDVIAGGLLQGIRGYFESD
jgi:N-acetylmuramoyl-L-alanine amidase